METLRIFFSKLRVFKRLRLYREAIIEHTKRLEMLESHRTDVEEFFESREPCGTCGHHRYRQKTLHRAECG